MRGIRRRSGGGNASRAGAVEGINNKARVITKRCYGVKSAGRSMGELRQMAACLKAVCSKPNLGPIFVVTFLHLL